MIARTDEGVIAVPPLRGYVAGRTPDARPRRVALDDYGEISSTSDFAEAFGREPAPMPVDEDARGSPT